jgi:hypothetical protein
MASAIANRSRFLDALELIRHLPADEVFTSLIGEIERRSGSDAARGGGKGCVLS